LTNIFEKVIIVVNIKKYKGMAKNEKIFIVIYIITLTFCIMSSFIKINNNISKTDKIQIWHYHFKIDGVFPDRIIKIAK